MLDTLSRQHELELLIVAAQLDGIRAQMKQAAQGAAETHGPDGANSAKG